MGLQLQLGFPSPARRCRRGGHWLTADNLIRVGDHFTCKACYRAANQRATRKFYAIRHPNSTTMRELLDEVARTAERLDGMPTITDNEVNNMEQQPTSTKVETDAVVYRGKSSQDTLLESSRRDVANKRQRGEVVGTPVTANPIFPVIGPTDTKPAPGSGPTIGRPDNLSKVRPGFQQGLITPVE